MLINIIKIRKRVFFITLLFFLHVAVSAQVITTIAGNGSKGRSENNVPATAASFNYPDGVAVDDSGNVFFSDFNNNLVWELGASGYMHIAAGRNGGVAYNEAEQEAELNLPAKVRVDNGHNLYIADCMNNEVRKVNEKGIISIIAGTGTKGYGGDEGPATDAALNVTEGVSSVDDRGNLYICDEVNNRIRKVDASGHISTVAGSGVCGYSGDGGAATACKLNYPRGVAYDEAGNLYIADFHNNAIRKVNSAGVVTTIAGDGDIRYSGDGGPATAASLNGPAGLATYINDTGGLDLYVADEYNGVIRKIDSKGTISTVAGTGVQGYNGDGGLAVAAQLHDPVDVALDDSGNLYIADAYNYRIRKVKHVEEPRQAAGKPIIKFQPDPETGICIVELPEFPAPPTLEVTDMHGKVLISEACATGNAQKASLNFKGFKPAMYTVNVICKGKVYSYRLVVDLHQ